MQHIGIFLTGIIALMLSGCAYGTINNADIHLRDGSFISNSRMQDVRIFREPGTRATLRGVNVIWTGKGPQ